MHTDTLLTLLLAGWIALLLLADNSWSMSRRFSVKDRNGRCAGRYFSRVHAKRVARSLSKPNDVYHVGN